MSDTNNNCYLVRTIQELVHQGFVGIGWSKFDFSSYSSAEDLIKDINNDYGVGRRGNQLRRFFNIKEDDFVVVPLSQTVAIGKAKGPLLHQQDPWGQYDRANLRKVEFLVDSTGSIIEIPRKNFSEGFQRRIRVMGMTVNDLNSFSDEIHQAYDAISDGGSHSWVLQINEQKKTEYARFRKKLLSNIQSGKTNLQGGGLGLEKLVNELLTINGYESTICAKTKFNSFADADILATKDDVFSQTELLVQVKHHHGLSGEHGINQLTEIRKLHPDEADGRQLVFVTSAAVSDAVVELAKKEEVIIIDGDKLVLWIEDNLSQLSAETLKSLGIFANFSTID